MSGIVSGITKVFTTVGSAAARVGKAVLGVGATTFTAGAATGAGPLASGGLAGLIQKFTGTGVLGNILTGAITQAGYGAVIGAATSALTGGNIGRGALMGAAGGAVSGGIMGAAGLNPDPLTKGFGQKPDGLGVDTGLITGSTATGAVPTGKTASGLSDASFNARAGGGFTPNLSTPTIYTPAAPVTAEAPASGGSFSGGGFGKFLTSEMGGQVIGGLGKGLAGYMEAKQKKEENEAVRAADLAREMRIRDSYNVGGSALHGATPADTGRPTPAMKYRYVYNQAQGRVVLTAT